MFHNVFVKEQRVVLVQHNDMPRQNDCKEDKKTDYETLAEICSTWIICPLISGIIAIVLYFLVKKLMKYSSMHLLMLDQLTRIGLILTAAVGAYALGANNIANVVGVFVPSCPFHALSFGGLFTLEP